VVVFTDRDARALAPAAGSTPLVTIAVGAAVPERPLDPAGAHPPGIVFVGNFTHPPNVDAAERLARGVLPLAHARCPDLTLHLVGDAPPESVRALAGGHVVVTGRVADVAPYLDRAAVVAAPLRQGGGMRVKVLEALAAGKAIVATPLAAAGLAVQHGEHLLLAESDEELAAAIVTLVEDRERRVALAAGARAWAVAHLGWDQPADAYSALYERLLRGGPAW
jgi:glycosyltransferase involved in cell wall biosynthesis